MAARAWDLVGAPYNVPLSSPSIAQICVIKLPESDLYRWLLFMCCKYCTIDIQAAIFKLFDPTPTLHPPQVILLNVSRFGNNT